MVAPFVAFEVNINRWAELRRNFKPAVGSVIRKSGFDAYAKSQNTVPVRRPDVERRTGVTGGFLKNSGQVDASIDNQSIDIAYTAYYAGYVHEGTVKMPARPFLREAVEDVVPSMEMAFSQLERRLLP